MPENSTKKKGLHPGWWMMITAFAIFFLCYAPCINMVGLFYLPLSNAIGVSTTAIGLGVTIAFIASLPACLVAGKLFTMTKIRYVEAVLLGIIVLSFLVNAFVPNLTVYYVCCVVRGFCSPLCPMVALSILSDRWFGPKARGKALGIATIGSGLGQMIMSPVVAAIMEASSYTWGYITLGIMSLVCIPLVLAFWKESPVELGLERIGEADPSENIKTGNEIYGPSLKKVLSSPVFWLGWIAMFLLCNGTQTLLSLGSTFFQNYGFSAVVAATLMSCGSVGLIVGKLGLGIVIDKFGVRIGLPLGGVLMCIGYGVMLANTGNPSFIVMAIGAVFFGLGCAVCNLAIPMFTSAMVGTRAYAVSVSLIQFATSFGAGILPTVFGGMGFTIAWAAAIICPLLAAIFITIVLAIRAKRPAATLG